MKKRSIQLIIMAFISLLLLGGGIFSFVRQNNSGLSETGSQAVTESKEQTQQEGQKLFSDVNDNINLISYTYNKENIELSFQENEWHNQESKAFPLDQNKAAAMASALTNLTYYDAFPKTSGELADYGLKTPALTVSFQTSAGVQNSVSFGDINAVTGFQYCLVNGSDSIYLVDSSVANALSLGRDELMSYDSLPSYTTSDVTALIVQSESGTYQCTYSESGSSKQYTVYPWQETSTKKDKALDTTSFSSFLSGICSMDIAKCIDYEPSKKDLKKYHLSENNTCKLTVSYQLEQENDMETDTADANNSQKVQEPVYEQYSYNITIGKDYNKDYAYMTFSLSDYVYLIDKETADMIRSFSPSHYEPLDVCLIPLDTINTLDISFGGKDGFTISRGSTTTTDDFGSETIQYLYYKDKKEIDSDAFETLYDSFTSMKAEKQIKETKTSEKTPVLTLDFHRNTEDFSEMTLNFYTYDTNYYLVEFNGHRNLLVNRMDIEHYIEEWKEL